MEVRGFYDLVRKSFISRKITEASHDLIAVNLQLFLSEKNAHALQNKSMLHR